MHHGTKQEKKFEREYEVTHVFTIICNKERQIGQTLLLKGYLVQKKKRLYNVKIKLKSDKMNFQKDFWI